MIFPGFDNVLARKPALGQRAAQGHLHAGAQLAQATGLSIFWSWSASNRYMASNSKIRGLRGLRAATPCPAPPHRPARLLRWRSRRHRDAERGFPVWALAIISLVGVGAAAAGAGVDALIIYNSYADELVAPDELAINQPSYGAKILDRNGKLLYEYVDDKSGLRRPAKSRTSRRRSWPRRSRPRTTASSPTPA